MVWPGCKKVFVPAPDTLRLHYMVIIIVKLNFNQLNLHDIDLAFVLFDYSLPFASYCCYRNEQYNISDWIEHSYGTFLFHGKKFD